MRTGTVETTLQEKGSCTQITRQAKILRRLLVRPLVHGNYDILVNIRPRPGGEWYPCGFGHLQRKPTMYIRTHPVAGVDAAPVLAHELLPDHRRRVQRHVAVGQQQEALVARLLERLPQQQPLCDADAWAAPPGLRFTSN